MSIALVWASLVADPFRAVVVLVLLVVMALLLWKLAQLSARSDRPPVKIVTMDASPRLLLARRVTVCFAELRVSRQAESSRRLHS